MSRPDTMRLLAEGEISLRGQVVWSSNAAFVVQVCRGQARLEAIYKPRRGEAPLWDFPAGTLCQRERAAFLISEALGWDLVPPTVLRPGPLGRGALQLFIDHDPDLHYLSMERIDHGVLAQLVAFDVVINNADRKSGHVLRDADGHIWAIDHGVTFHAEHKLRTVIWDLAGQRLPPSVTAALVALAARLDDGADPLTQELQQLLAPAERRALRRRLAALAQAGIFPDPDPSRRAIPWPPV